MIVVLIAGIAAIVAGVAAIVLGIPVKEFSFGNTLILVGGFACCTGLILIAMALVTRELKQALAGIRPIRPADLGPAPRTASEEPAIIANEMTPSEPDLTSPLPPRGRAEPDLGPAESEPPSPPRRRNLLFTSSRRERERAVERAPVPDVSVERPPELPPLPSPAEAEPPPPRSVFEDTWNGTRPERPRMDSPRRSERPVEPRIPEPRAPEPQPPEPPRPPPAPARPPIPVQAEVTVLKSGVVDGMAYTLYSDGSIETQMPEGIMRFASIDELRAHLDQRPG